MIETSTPKTDTLTLHASTVLAGGLSPLKTLNKFLLIRGTPGSHRDSLVLGPGESSQKGLSSPAPTGNPRTQAQTGGAQGLPEPKQDVRVWTCWWLGPGPDDLQRSRSGRAIRS